MIIDLVISFRMTWSNKVWYNMLILFNIGFIFKISIFLMVFASSDSFMNMFIFRIKCLSSNHSSFFNVKNINVFFDLFFFKIIIWIPAGGKYDTFISIGQATPGKQNNLFKIFEYFNMVNFSFIFYKANLNNTKKTLQYKKSIFW